MHNTIPIQEFCQTPALYKNGYTHHSTNSYYIKKLIFTAPQLITLILAVAVGHSIYVVPISDLLMNPFLSHGMITYLAHVTACDYHWSFKRLSKHITANTHSFPRCLGVEENLKWPVPCLMHSSIHNCRWAT